MQFGEIILGERKGTHNPNLEKLTSSSPTWPPKDFDLLQSAAQDNRRPCASVCLLGGGEGWASLLSHVAVWAPRRSPSVFQTHQRRAGERDTGDTRGAQCSRCSAQASYQSCGNAMLRAKSTWPRTSANIWGVPDSAGATGAASQAPASKNKKKKMQDSGCWECAGHVCAESHSSPAELIKWTWKFGLSYLSTLHGFQKEHLHNCCTNVLCLYLFIYFRFKLIVIALVTGAEQLNAVSIQS